jgi:diguanylate cyclase (GGDEF)-like protein
MAARSLRSGIGRRLSARAPELLLILLVLCALRLPRPGGEGWSWWQWVLWLGGLAAVPAAARLRGKGRGNQVLTLLAALLLLNGAVVLTGGAGSPLWPGYFVFLAVAASSFRRWWHLLLIWGAVTLLEGAQFAVSAEGHVGIEESFRSLLVDGAALAPGLPGLVVRLALLGGFAVLLSLLFLREQKQLQESLRDHIRLREEVDHLRGVEEDLGGAELEAHSPRGKMVRRTSVADKLNGDLDRLLDLTRRAVGARAAVYFQREGNRFTFRRAAAEGVKIDEEANFRVGEGVVGGAARHGTALMLSNVEKGRHRVNFTVEGEEPSSLMVVPVKEQGVLRGVLVADHPGADRFSKSELEVLEGFSIEVNLLLENFRESSLRDRRKMTIETLNALGKTLSESLRVDEMLDKLVDRIGEVIPYDQCAVFLVDRERKKIVLQTQRGFRFENPKDVFFPLGKKCLVSHLVKHAQPLVFSDRKKMEIIPGYTGIEPMSSFLGLPFSYHDDLEGALIFASEAKGSFTHYHLDTLKLFSYQIAAQISNASLHQQVEKMALTDGLTGLYNHRHFQESLSHELERAGRHDQYLSLLLLDIDYFKKLNDTYGHPFGDVVLKGVSARLAGMARGIDFVARYGGEEFAVILTATGRRGCQTMAHRILKVVRALSFDHEGTPVSVTLSVGSATFPKDGEKKEDLIRHADQALYLAKESGRDQSRSFRDVVRE